MEDDNVQTNKNGPSSRLKIRDGNSCQPTNSRDSLNNSETRTSDVAGADAATCRSSAKKIASVIAKFDDAKKNLVRSIGWGGILQMPQINKVSRRFTVWILSHIDTEKREIVIKDDARIPLRGRDFAKVIGIPSGPKKVNGLDSTHPEDKMDFIKHYIGSVGSNPEEINSLKAAEHVVTQEYPHGFCDNTASNFKVSFVCFIIGNFISGKQRVNHGSKDFWGSLLKDKEIEDYDWGEYAVDEIIESAKKVKEYLLLKKPIQNVTGCSLGLQVTYLDSLDLAVLNIDKAVLPRVAAFDCESLRIMMEADQASTSCCSSVDSVSYGCNKLKPMNPADSEVNEARNRNNTDTNKTSPSQFGTSNTTAIPPTRCILDSFMNGSIQTKLSYKQIEALRWFNARTIRNFETLKSLILGKQVISTGLNFPSSSAELPTKTDQSLNFIESVKYMMLEDNNTLATKLNDHVILDGLSKNASGANLSTKRIAEDSNSGCESVNQGTSPKKKFKVILEDQVTSHDNSIRNIVSSRNDRLTGGGHMPQTTPFAIRSQNYIRFNAHENDERHARVTGDDTLTEAEKMNHTELSLDLTLIFPGPVDATPTNNIAVLSNPANMFKTPTNLAPLVAKTQASSVQIMSEAAVFDRIIQEEETLNINARVLDFDIDDTSEIIQISNGPIVKNRWFLGNLSKEREPGMVNCLFKWLDEAESPTLNRIYIMHPKPRHIEITGIDLRGSFLNGQDYTYDLMDMSVRRSNQMDLQMRGAETKITWRHTMESDFAMFVLGNEDPLACRSVCEQFRRIQYDISLCRMVIIPALLDLTWCSYFWDMKGRIVHVVDPTFIHERSLEVTKMHDANIEKLQLSFLKCANHFYKGWNVNSEGWKRNYVAPMYPGATSSESGVLTVAAIRYFNGQGFVKNYTKATINEFSRQLLYELFSTKGNMSKVTDVYVQDLDD